MKYEIIDKPDVSLMRAGKWRHIFADLPFEKAIKFNCTNKKEAKKIGVNISSSLRQGKKLDYKCHYRILPDGNSINLYVWKEALNDIVKLFDRNRGIKDCI